MAKLIRYTISLWVAISFASCGEGGIFHKHNHIQDTIVIVDTHLVIVPLDTNGHDYDTVDWVITEDTLYLDSLEMEILEEEQKYLEEYEKHLDSLEMMLDQLDSIIQLKY